MVVHGLIPPTNDHRSFPRDVNCITVVWQDVDVNFDDICPLEAGVKRHQRGSQAVLAPPYNALCGWKESPVALMVEGYIDRVRSIVGKREQIGMSYVGGPLANPMGRDGEAWLRVALRLNRC